MATPRLPPANPQSVGERFDTERTRLRLGVQQAADACGVTRNAIFKVINCGTLPSGAVLQKFALAGADVHYILTGQRREGIADDLDAVLDFIVDSPCRCQPETETLAGHTCQRCRLLKKLRGKPTPQSDEDNAKPSAEPQWTIRLPLMTRGWAPPLDQHVKIGWTPAEGDA